MDETFQRLENTLQELSLEYDSLSQVMKLEREFLIQADIEKLNESNLLKEALVRKIKELDLVRIELVQGFADELDLKDPEPRLLVLANALAQSKKKIQADRLKQRHHDLEQLIARVSSQNKENELYAANALKMVRGAMGNIKDYFSGKKVYQRKGTLSENSERSGNFVSREA